MKVKSESEVAQLCLTLSDPMDCSLPGSSIHGFSRQEYWSGVPYANNNGDFENQHVFLVWTSLKEAREIHHRGQKKEGGRIIAPPLPTQATPSLKSASPAWSMEGCTCSFVLCRRLTKNVVAHNDISLTVPTPYHWGDWPWSWLTRFLKDGWVLSTHTHTLCALEYDMWVTFHMKRILCTSYQVNGHLPYVYPLDFCILVDIAAQGSLSPCGRRPGYAAGERSHVGHH